MWQCVHHRYCWHTRNATSTNIKSQQTRYWNGPCITWLRRPAPEWKTTSIVVLLFLRCFPSTSDACWCFLASSWVCMCAHTNICKHKYFEVFSDLVTRTHLFCNMKMQNHRFTASPAKLFAWVLCVCWSVTMCHLWVAHVAFLCVYVARGQACLCTYGPLIHTQQPELSRQRTWNSKQILAALSTWNLRYRDSLLEASLVFVEAHQECQHSDTCYLCSQRSTFLNFEV